MRARATLRSRRIATVPPSICVSARTRGSADDADDADDRGQRELLRSKVGSLHRFSMVEGWSAQVKIGATKWPFTLPCRFSFTPVPLFGSKVQTIRLRFARCRIADRAGSNQRFPRESASSAFSRKTIARTRPIVATRTPRGLNASWASVACWAPASQRTVPTS